jgi:DNA-directed RNA polymerase I subunit RPA2
MERDALLAHGVAYLVHDRLFHCSDATRALVCTKCGSLLAPRMRPPEGAAGRGAGREAVCGACGDGAAVDVIALPYVFLYLTNELAAMNIKVRVGTKCPAVLRGGT